MTIKLEIKFQPIQTSAYTAFNKSCVLRNYTSDQVLVASSGLCGNKKKFSNVFFSKLTPNSANLAQILRH